MKAYGKELIIDLCDCNISQFNRTNIKYFLLVLCKIIGMTPHDMHFWDDEGVPEAECQTDPKTKGTSAILFLMESNITVHTLDLLGKVFINIFSCKDFNVVKATDYAKQSFGGKVQQAYTIKRL